MLSQSLFKDFDVWSAYVVVLLNQSASFRKVFVSSNLDEQAKICQSKCRSSCNTGVIIDVNSVASFCDQVIEMLSTME